MVYDVCIVGGGISGLYTAYLLVKQNINNIIIIEKEPILGGRIQTINTKVRGRDILYEAGAGIVCSTHTLLMKLLKELDLCKYLTEKKGHTEYNLRNHTTDYPYYGNPDETPLKKSILLKMMYKKLSKLPKKILLNNTLQSAANMVMSSETYKFITDSFGYDSEFTTSNAYDAIRLLSLYSNMNTKYLKLECGLVHICEKIADIITKCGVKIKTNTEMSSMKYANNIYTINSQNNTNKTNIKARHVVLSVPRECLIKIKELSPINDILQSVAPVSFNRVYAVYPLNANGKAWFDDIDKIITDKLIRIIQPMDKTTGLIMVSYTHGEFANIWKNATNSSILEDFLSYQLSQMFPNKRIPKPLYIKNHYWAEGVHYWKPGFRSKNIYPSIIKPFKDKPLYISGESYSMVQGWIEGSLETSISVVSRIKKDMDYLS